jgi:Leucine-rich repeat (LRR) protein
MKISVFLAYIFCYNISNGELLSEENEQFNGILTHDKLRQWNFNQSSTEIILTNRRIKFIELVAFEKFKNLKKLDLSNNEIEEIKLTSFRFLSNLNSLNLRYNKIKCIQDYAFNDLENLLNLNLANNRIEIITNKTFSGLKRIYELSVYNNEIRTIEGNSFSDLAEAKFIDLVNILIFNVFFLSIILMNCLGKQ